MTIKILRARGAAIVTVAVLALVLAGCAGAATSPASDSPPGSQVTPETLKENTPPPGVEAATSTPIVIPLPTDVSPPLPAPQELAALLAFPTASPAKESESTPVENPPATLPPAPAQEPVASPGEKTQATSVPTPTPVPAPTPFRLVGGKVGNQAAEVQGIKAWINSEPLTVQALRGKVVLVDFWTYTCINCIRTFPFLKLWHSSYADDGLVILGVHAPEFEFEKDLDNVVKATRDNGILWPVAMDNDFVTWKNYSNQFWPAKYLIDQDGVVRYTHFGEGKYAETEEMIRQLLDETGADLDDDTFALPSDQSLDPIYRDDIRAEITRELYAGYERGYQDRVFGRGGYVRQQEYYQERDAVVSFTIPKELYPNVLYFNGPWFLGPESARHGRDTENYEDHLTLVYSARSVNAVLTSESGEDYKVRVTMNGEYLTEENKGEDIIIGPDGESYLSVTEPKMYNILENPSYVRRQVLEMSSNSDDFGLFAFTFGVYQKV